MRQPTPQTTEIKALCQLATFYRGTLFGRGNFQLIAFFELVGLVATVQRNHTSISIDTLDFTFNLGSKTRGRDGRNEHQNKRSSTNFLHDRSPLNDLSGRQNLSGIRNECTILSYICNEE